MRRGNTLATLPVDVDVTPGGLCTQQFRAAHQTRPRSREEKSMLRTLASAVALSAIALTSSCTTPGASSDSQAAAAEPAKPAGPHPGEAVYKTNCAACHDNPEATKAPSRATLARMASGNISNALITGKMIAQGARLSSAEVSYVSDYLSEAHAVSDDWITAMRCPASRATP